MKKTIVISVIGLASFGALYYFTGSLKISLIAFVLIALYIIWVMVFELGVFKLKKGEKTAYNQAKKEHNQASKDNPTLR